MPSISFSGLNEINRAAKEFREILSTNKIIAFEGEMGVGKTTFIKALCAELGVIGNVNSPSFSIVNEYITEKEEKIFHFDFYRIKNSLELFDIGFEEYLNQDAYIFIEWPQKALEVLPEDVLYVKMSVLPDETRLMSW